jgi:hypothetical protein
MSSMTDAMVCRMLADDIINASPEHQENLLAVHHQAIADLERQRADAEAELNDILRSLAMRHRVLSLVEEARL